MPDCLEEVMAWDNPSLPPFHVLHALRQPRRPQLADPCIREMLKRWKRLGKSPIILRELGELADLVAPESNVKQMRRILGAVEAAGLRLASEVRGPRGMETARWAAWKLRFIREQRSKLQYIREQRWKRITVGDVSMTAPTPQTRVEPLRRGADVDRSRAGLPPPHVLEALRQPRRPQLHDHQVRALFRRWRRLGRPITIDELKVLVDLLVPEQEICVDRLERIMAAVEAAGITVQEVDARPAVRAGARDGRAAGSPLA